jgi:hypothetical protein
VTETPGGVKTLAIRLPDDLHAQLVLVAQLDGLSLAEAIRQAVESSINRRRDAGELADRAQAALEQIEQESAIRRTALQALLGPASARPEQPAEADTAAKPTGRRRGGETSA